MRSEPRRCRIPTPPEPPELDYAVALFFPTAPADMLPRRAYVHLAPEMTPLAQEVLLNGQREALAIELHKLLGLGAAIMERWIDRELSRVYTRTPSGYLIDADGVFIAPYGTERDVHTISRERLEGERLPPATRLVRHYAPIVLRAIKAWEVKHASRMVRPDLTTRLVLPHRWYTKQELAAIKAEHRGGETALAVRDRGTAAKAELRAEVVKGPDGSTVHPGMGMVLRVNSFASLADAMELTARPKA